MGCGTGEHVLLTAGLGSAAIGIELAGNALAQAQDRHLQPATMEITTDPDGIRAWLATLTRC
ncbi:hypothetical protein [Amycolatopsis taiwanensis]|uniref:hypothetical protein n=1 Tax=Amycolatopsis taiwanensis TaxID=342230 RepID=UPI0004883BB5|nr:hypothetical protein [Amycolatopsis taiwanensis]